MQKGNKLYLGDCLNVLPEIETDSIDAIVTDPPYFLLDENGNGFMGKKWDSLYTSKINNIICKSKEFVNFAERFFTLMQVESNTDAENTVPNNVNTGQCPEKEEKGSYANTQSVERDSCDNPHISKVNISSVHGLVLTKAEVLNLLSALSLKNIIAFGKLNENALFVIPISYIIKSLKNTVAISALKSLTKKVCVEQGILLTSMEEARIKSAIEAITGMRSERSVMPEMDINADTAGSTVEEKRYKHIMLSHTEKEEVMSYLISLLYVLFLMPELNKSPNSSFKDIQSRDLIYRFHKNWAIEALRILKPGAFAFVMSSPRSDLLPLMTTALRDAGFTVSFSSIYHTYATGFPKALNISKVVDKRANVEQKTIGVYMHPDRIKRNYTAHTKMAGTVFAGKVDKYNEAGRPITIPTTEKAKALEGAYSGFQPKPAVEIVIVAMKPLSEKSYINQALKNEHGCTWLDGCRIPFESDKDATFSDRPNCYNKEYTDNYFFGKKCKSLKKHNSKGRFPANVLCEDDVLNDGNTRTTGNEIKNGIINSNGFNPVSTIRTTTGHVPGDSGSYSRYFSLDAWFAERIKLLPKEAHKIFPWLIVQKASKSEKDRGCEDLEGMLHFPSNNESGNMLSSGDNKPQKIKGNFHPTCKPLKLMSWLITLASREGDIILDPFCGSGTTLIAAKMLSREYIGIELEKEYYDIARLRIDDTPQNINKFL